MSASSRDYHRALAKALREHPEARDDITRGRRAAKFIVGSAVKASKGQLDAYMLSAYLRHRKVGGVL